MAPKCVKYPRGQEKWLPPFKCPHIYGLDVEVEAADTSVDRDLDVYEGFSGSRSIVMAARAHGLSADGFDYERGGDVHDILKETGFKYIMGQCKRVKPSPEGLNWWGDDCSMWAVSSVSVHKRGGKDQFEHDAIGLATYISREP